MPETPPPSRHYSSACTGLLLPGPAIMRTSGKTVCRPGARLIFRRGSPPEANQHRRSATDDYELAAATPRILKPGPVDSIHQLLVVVPLGGGAQLNWGAARRLFEGYFLCSWLVAGRVVQAVGRQAGLALFLLIGVLFQAKALSMSGGQRHFPGNAAAIAMGAGPNHLRYGLASVVAASGRWSPETRRARNTSAEIGLAIGR